MKTETEMKQYRYGRAASQVHNAIAALEVAIFQLEQVEDEAALLAAKVYRNNLHHFELVLDDKAGE